MKYIVSYWDLIDNKHKEQCFDKPGYAIVSDIPPEKTIVSPYQRAKHCADKLANFPALYGGVGIWQVWPTNYSGSGKRHPKAGQQKLVKKYYSEEGYKLPAALLNDRWGADLPY